MSSCLHSRCSQYNNRSGKTRPRHPHRCAGTHESPVHTGYELSRNGSGKRIFTNYNWKLNTDFREKEALVRCQQMQQMNPTVVSNASPMFQKERASFPVPYPTPLSLLSLAAISVPSLFCYLQSWGCTESWFYSRTYLQPFLMTMNNSNLSSYTQIIFTITKNKLLGTYLHMELHLMLHKNYVDQGPALDA